MELFQRRVEDDPPPDYPAVFAVQAQKHSLVPVFYSGDNE